MNWSHNQKSKQIYSYPDFLSTTCVQYSSDNPMYLYRYFNKYTIFHFCYCGSWLLLSDIPHLKQQSYWWTILLSSFFWYHMNPRQNHLYWIWNTLEYSLFVTLVTSCNLLGRSLSTRVIVFTTVEYFDIKWICSLV